MIDPDTFGIKSNRLQNGFAPSASLQSVVCPSLVATLRRGEQEKAPQKAEPRSITSGPLGGTGTDTHP